MINTTITAINTAAITAKAIVEPSSAWLEVPLK
jgi:hypothetical protein